MACSIASPNRGGESGFPFLHFSCSFPLDSFAYTRFSDKIPTFSVSSQGMLPASAADSDYPEAWMKELKSRSFRITIIVLFVVGLGIGVWQGVSRASSAFVFVSDLFFSEFLVFLLFGVIRMLGNMRAFTSAAYSFRFVHRLFRNQKVSGKESQEEYRKYRESRAEHPEAKWYLIFACAFLALSLIFLPFAVHR